MSNTNTEEDYLLGTCDALLKEGEDAGRYGYGATEEAAIKELKQKFDWSEA
jgi:hypothetical protein